MRSGSGNRVGAAQPRGGRRTSAPGSARVTKREVLEALVEARRALSRPGGWSQGDLAQDEDGNTLHVFAKGERRRSR
jgi:hypothetical protein